jgi:hypothetical protein
VSHRKYGRLFLLRKPFRFFVWPSQKGTICSSVVASLPQTTSLPLCFELHHCLIASSCLLLPLPFFAFHCFVAFLSLPRCLSLLFVAFVFFLPLVALLNRATSHCFATFFLHATLLLGCHRTLGTS